MKKEYVNRADIETTLHSVEKAMAELQVKVKAGTPSDLVRLMQLRKDLMEELDNDAIEEIRVTWVEPKPESVTEE
jgi:hypothetical protein